MRNNTDVEKLHKYKFLVRNLRNGEHEKLKIQTNGANVRFPKSWESVHFPGEIKPNNGE